MKTSIRIRVQVSVIRNLGDTRSAGLRAAPEGPCCCCGRQESVWGGRFYRLAIGMAIIVGLIVAIVAFLFGWFLINVGGARLRRWPAGPANGKKWLPPKIL